MLLLVSTMLVSLVWQAQAQDVGAEESVSDIATSFRGENADWGRGGGWPGRGPGRGPGYGGPGYGGPGYGGPGYGGPGNGGPGYPPPPPPPPRPEYRFESLYCGPYGGRYTQCFFDPRAVVNVEFAQQNSNSPCQFRVSYGVERDFVWVQNGCRATFRITRYY